MRPPLRAAPKAQRGPERYWALIRERAEGFTLRQIHVDAPGVTREAIRAFVYGCINLGLVELAGTVPTSTNNARDTYVFRCLKPHAPTPVVRTVASSDQGRRLQQLWNAMRALPQFTTDELAVAASTDEVAIKRGRAAELIHGLKRYGLVRVVQPKQGRQNGSTPAVYALVRKANTGPKPPRINRERRAVFDANKSRWIAAPKNAEVSA